MFDQKINLQLFGEEDFTDISGAEVSESAEDTARINGKRCRNYGRR